MASSFTAEAAADLPNIWVYSRRILRHMARLILPLALVMALGAPLVLSLFGETYARESSSLLRWLAVAAVPILINNWYLSYARVLNDIRTVVIFAALQCVLTLALGLLLLPGYGIVGIGLAWLISQGLLAVLALIRTGPMLLQKAADDRTLPVQVLRRADWRFLMSRVRPRSAVCLADGLLAQAVEAISDTVVDPAKLADGDCDLSVAVNPDTDTLRTAYRALRVGGECYTEWTPWRMGGARGVRQRLEGAGFSNVRLYWPWPTPAASRFWLPLEPPGAPYGYLAAVLFGGIGPARLLRYVCPFLLRALVRAGLMRHLVAAGTRLEGEAGAAPDSAADRIRAIWRREHGDSSGERMSFIVRTGGRESLSKVNFLVFAGADPRPRWVVKLPRLDLAADALRRERDNLRSLPTRNGKIGKRLAVPRIVLWDEEWDVPILGQNALRGQPLAGAVCRHNFRELACEVADCLAEWADGSQPVRREQLWEQLVEPLLAGVERGFGPVVEPDLMARTRRALDPLGDLPVVPVHRDCAPWNIVVSDDGLGMFDWEDARPQGLPLTDLVYCVSNMAFCLNKTVASSRMAETYRSLRTPQTELGDAFDDALMRYAARLGIPAQSIRPLRLLTWLSHVDEEFRWLCRDMGSPPQTSLLEQSVCVPLWRAELDAV